MHSASSLDIVSIQKPILFLYSSNENLEIEIFKNTIYSSTKKHEIRGINLTKHLQDIYNEN